MKKITRPFAMLFVLIALSISLQAQTKSSLAVISLDTNGSTIDAATGIDLIRLELQKTNTYSIVDKYEISDAVAKDTSLRNCFSKQCMVNAGNVLHADKMLSGSLETFGQKIVITLRLVDVKLKPLRKLM